MQLEKLSPGLRAIMSDVATTSPQRPIRVLLTLRSAPKTAVYQAALEPTGHDMALDALEEAGVDRGIFRETRISPRHVFSALQTGESAKPESVLAQPPFLGGAAVDATPETIDLLSDSEAVEAVVEDREHRIHLDVTGPMVGADAAFQSDIKGEGVIVAVIDSGIDESHAAFAGRISPLSKNFSDEGDASHITDLNGHGTHVAGIIGGSSTAGTAYRGVAPDVTLLVLKVFTSRGRARLGDVSAAVDYAISNGANVINYSGGFAPWQPPHLVVRPPWVWSHRETFEELVFNAAPARGVVAVVSAGNEGTLAPPESTISVPGIAEHVITVGSVEKAQQATAAPLSDFSSQGPVRRSDVVPIGDVRNFGGLGSADVVEMRKPDIVAPGGNYDQVSDNLGDCPFTSGVISAKASQGGPKIRQCAVDQAAYTRLSGTSMSAPVVTGLVALILDYARQNGIDIHTELTRAFMVKNLILKKATDLGLPPAKQGWGLVNWNQIESSLDAIRRGDDSLDNYAPR